MSNKRSREFGTLHCPVCGQMMMIPRRNKRAVGHVKTMYCGICMETRDFVEGEQSYEAKYKTANEK